MQKDLSITTIANGLDKDPTKFLNAELLNVKVWAAAILSYSLRNVT